MTPEAEHSKSLEVGADPARHLRHSSRDRIGGGQGYQVRILKSVSEIEEYRSLWINWQGHPNSNFELFRLMLETRKEIVRPNVVVLTRLGAIEALLLGRLEQCRVPIKLGYFTFWSPRVRSLIVMHEGFLGHVTEEAVTAAVRALMRELTDAEADRVYLSNQREDSPIANAARSVPGFFARDAAIVRSVHRSMKLPPNPGEFLGRMKSSDRSFITRKLRRIRSKARELECRFPGSVRYVMFSRAEDLPKAMADVEEVARKTYHRGLGVGFKKDAEHLHRFEMEAVAGRLRICILYAGGMPRAFWIGFVYGDKCHSAFTGYDPEMRDYEVGMLVFVHLVDLLCEEKVKVFDFGLGDALYKERFADQFWNEVCISIYRSTLRGLSLKAAFTICCYLSWILELLLQRLNILQRLKREWRARLAPAVKQRGIKD